MEELADPSSTAPPKPDLDSLEWRVHLAARQPARAALALLAVALSAAIGWLSLGNVVAALAAAALLLGAVAEFLFPVTYQLTKLYAEARGILHWRRISWQEVKRVQVGEYEIRLSPLRFPGPRDAFRGVVLRCPDNRDEVRDAIRRLRESASGEMGPQRLQEGTAQGDTTAD